jgi:large subunit ribosomal protein L16
VRGNAWRGNEVAFGEYGLQSLEGGWLSAQCIEAGRVTASHFLRAETRMGKGKGEPEYWAAVVKPGQILYEIGGVPEDAARECLARVAHKMPFKCRFVTRRPSIGG